MIGLLASEHFAKSPFLSFAIVALLIFMVVFTVTTIRTLLTQRGEIAALERLPLEVDDE